MVNQSTETVHPVVEHEMIPEFSIPEWNLEHCIQLAASIEALGAGSIPIADIAMDMRSSVDSSNFRSQIEALNIFGLAKSDGDSVKMTPRIRSILSRSSGKTERARELFAAFYQVDLFRGLMDKFHGRPLVDRLAVRYTLEQDFDVARSRSDMILETLLTSADLAGALIERDESIYFARPEFKDSRATVGKRAEKPTNGEKSESQKSLFQLGIEGAGQNPEEYIIGITEDDMAGLTEVEYKEVWETFGKLLRRRAQRHSGQSAGKAKK